jgi:hypothetical protein
MTALFLKNVLLTDQRNFNLVECIFHKLVNPNLKFFVLTFLVMTRASGHFRVCCALVKLYLQYASTTHSMEQSPS